MRKRHLLSLLLMVGLLAALEGLAQSMNQAAIDGVSGGKAPRAGSVRPNIIFIYADDLGYGDLGCYGSPIAKTPNLDRLAAEGMLFTQYYDSHSTCSPTRASFITGQYPSRHRIFRPLTKLSVNAQVGVPDWLDVQAPSLPRALQQVGYRTGLIGKWHLGGGSGSQSRSTETMESMAEPPRPRPSRPVIINHPDAPPVTAYGFEFVRTAWGNGPTWHNAKQYPVPHQVYPYNDMGWVVWSSKAIADTAIEFLDDHIRTRKGQPFLLNVWLNDPHRPLFPTAEMREPYKGVPEPAQTHYAMITFMDMQIGRVLQRLKDLDLEKDTLVVFSSDNGGIVRLGASNGDLREGKWTVYEGGIRVPFIVRWPGNVPSGKRNTEAVLNLVDLAPTFCRLAGATMPPGYQSDGVDISDAILGRPFKRSGPMMWHHPIGVPETPHLAIREEDWKLLINLDSGVVELYDLANDVRESKNLANEEPAVVAKLKAELLKWYKSIPHSHNESRR